MPVASSTQFVALPLARAATLLVHQRSVPSSAASTGTDRSGTLVGARIRSITSEIALPAVNRMGVVLLRLNYMAPLAPSR